MSEKFDPFGNDYDYERATAGGLGPDPLTGHWGTVSRTTEEERQRLGLPEESYVVLKGRGHRTWEKGVAGEAERGFKVVEHGGRYYSVPKAWKPVMSDARQKEKSRQTRTERELRMLESKEQGVKPAAAPAPRPRAEKRGVGRDDSRANYERLAASLKAKRAVALEAGNKTLADKLSARLEELRKTVE